MDKETLEKANNLQTKLKGRKNQLEKVILSLQSLYSVYNYQLTEAHQITIPEKISITSKEQLDRTIQYLENLRGLLDVEILDLQEEFDNL